MDGITDSGLDGEEMDDARSMIDRSRARVSSPESLLHGPRLLNIVFCLQPVVDIAAWHTAALFVQLVSATCDGVAWIAHSRLVPNLIRSMTFSLYFSLWNRRCHCCTSHWLTL
jgi:hypothetical protein